MCVWLFDWVTMDNDDNDQQPGDFRIVPETRTEPPLRGEPPTPPPSCENLDPDDQLAEIFPNIDRSVILMILEDCVVTTQYEVLINMDKALSQLEILDGGGNHGSPCSSRGGGRMEGTAGFPVPLSDKEDASFELEDSDCDECGAWRTYEKVPHRGGNKHKHNKRPTSKFSDAKEWMSKWFSRKYSSAKDPNCDQSELVPLTSQGNESSEDDAL